VLAIQSAAPRWRSHYFEAGNGSKPLFLIAPVARAEARNAINLLALCISSEPAVTAAENV
jgi:hypothetical protein